MVKLKLIRAFAWWFWILFVMGCDSPLRNKVSSESFKTQNSKNDLFFKNLDLKVKYLWTEGAYPSVAKNSKIIVFIYNGKDQLTDLTEKSFLEFFATMPDMRNHELQDVGEFERLSRGVYENTGVVFQMGGWWSMDLSIFDLEGSELDRVEWQEFL